MASLVERLPPLHRGLGAALRVGPLLIAHGSSRRVIEVLRDLFGLSLSAGTIHSRAERAAQRAAQIKQARGLAWVRAGLHDENTWYEAYAAALPTSAHSERLEFTFTDGDRGRMSREEILLHVVTHGGYHRGNAGQMLKSIEVAPPRDLYTTFQHQTEPERRFE